MATIAEIREKYPQYSDMSDAALADALHSKFYSDIPKTDFYSKIGLQIGEKQYAPSVPQVTPEGQLIRQDAIPTERQQTSFEQNYPRLYRGAVGAREMLGPTVEALGAAGGAVLGTPLGPFGQVAGAGLGYGAAKEALTQADIALGLRAPRTVQETIIEPAQNVALGATLEGATPAVLRGISKAAGAVMDIGKGSSLKAGQIAREALESGSVSSVDLAKQQLRAAPRELTAAQATADMNAPLWQALNQRVAAQKGAVDDFTNKLISQADNDIANLNRLSGGQTQTGAIEAQQASKRALTQATQPVRETELRAANIAGRIEPTLRADIDRFAEGAAAKVEDVRRFTAAGERAAAAPNVPVLGMPRVATRYSYMGDLAERAEKVATEAAEGSLRFGEAARFKNYALQSLDAYGLRPLEAKPVSDSIRNAAMNPEYAGNRELTLALNRIAKSVDDWTGNGGVIDAFALDSIRKNAVNSVTNQIFKGADPKAQSKVTAQVMAQIRPAIVDAIENAGGTGYRQYLDDYAKGMQGINRQRMGAELQRLYKEQPDEFVALVRGDRPKIVEKILGYKNINLADEMGDDAMRVLNDAARTISSSKIAAEQASAGQEALRQLLEENVSMMRFPSLISAKFSVTNKAIDILERKVGKRVMNNLVEGLRNGQSAVELLDTLPARERNAVLKAISDPKTFGLPPSAVGVGATNMLAPEAQNQNALAR